MADQDRETVVIEDDRETRPSYGWIVALVVILGIILIFFLFGGMSLFDTSPQTQIQTTNEQVVPVQGE